MHIGDNTACNCAKIESAGGWTIFSEFRLEETEGGGGHFCSFAVMSTTNWTDLDAPTLRHGLRATEGLTLVRCENPRKRHRTNGPVPVVNLAVQANPDPISASR